MQMAHNKSLKPTASTGAASQVSPGFGSLRAARFGGGLARRCRGRFAPATTGRRISIREVARREAPHNHADQADFRRKSLRLSRLSRLIRRPVMCTRITLTFRSKNILYKQSVILDVLDFSF
jgi:hypothetical protein